MSIPSSVFGIRWPGSLCVSVRQNSSYNPRRLQSSPDVLQYSRRMRNLYCCGVAEVEVFRHREKAVNMTLNGCTL